MVSDKERFKTYSKRPELLNEKEFINHYNERIREAEELIEMSRQFRHKCVAYKNKYYY